MNAGSAHTMPRSGTHARCALDRVRRAALLIGGGVPPVPTSVAAAAAGRQQLDRLRGEMTAGTATPPRESVGPEPARLRSAGWPRSPIFYGIVVAVVAGVAGQWLSISPPAAYGLCSACHGRDLVDWTSTTSRASSSS